MHPPLRYLITNHSVTCLQVQPSKDCIQKTLKRLEDRIQGKVLHQIIYSLISSDVTIQQRTAVALTRLVKEADLRHVFIERKGIDVLLGILTQPSADDTAQKEAAGVKSPPPTHTHLHTQIHPKSFCPAKSSLLKVVGWPLS